MTKTDERFIRFGTGTNEVGDKSVPSLYNPSNYIPDQVSSEGIDKISAHLKGIDTKLGLLSVGGFSSEGFNSDGVSTDYLVAQAFGSITKIDVFFNGILKEEGLDWERDSSTNEIITLSNDGVTPEALSADTRVLIRVFASSPFSDEVFNTGSSPYTLTNVFDNNTSIDVYVNGILKEETNDWTRDSNTNQITILGDLSGGRIRFRLHNV